MYKVKVLTASKGLERSQEMYDWLVENCSDLFDSITIDTTNKLISCKIGDEQILGLWGYQPSPVKIYWKNYNVMSTNSSNNSYDFKKIHRTNNAMLFEFDSSYSGVYKPLIALIKTDSDIFFVSVGCNGTTNNTYYRYQNLGSSLSNFKYYIHSYNNGYGINCDKNIPEYYNGISDTAKLVQMRDTTEIGDLLPAYWLKETPTRDTGLITINGKEYFSNGIFCILNE